jgi:hypothetical protein
MRSVFFILLIAVTGCSKVNEGLVVIPKNKRTDSRLPEFFFNAGHLTYQVEFTPSCRYDIGDDQSDINKLFGFGYFPFHRDNSVRFGWRYNPVIDSIAIMAYWYDSGKRGIQHLRNVSIGSLHEYSIQTMGDAHLMKVDGLSHAIVYAKRTGLMYLLHPYFGGNRPAPQTIHLKMYRM